MQEKSNQDMKRMADEMAKDPEVLKSVANSRAAFEQGRTLTSAQALPRKTRKPARAG